MLGNLFTVLARQVHKPPHTPNRQRMWVDQRRIYKEMHPRTDFSRFPAIVALLTFAVGMLPVGVARLRCADLSLLDKALVCYHEFTPVENLYTFIIEVYDHLLAD
jgi:hypothetical protein